MWCVVGIFPILFVLVVAPGGHEVVQAGGHVLDCFGNHCTKNEVCKISSSGGHLDGGCIAAGHHIIIGCPTTLLNQQTCNCDTQDCIQHVSPDGHSLQAGVGHLNGLQCGDKTCNHDEGCEHTLHGGLFTTACHKLLELEKRDVLCTTLPTEHQKCYCTTVQCNQHLTNLIYQASHQQHESANYTFQCGDNLCTSGQICVFTEDGNNLHLHCADQVPHNIIHCLPILLTLGVSCYCDTRTCVDHTLVSIIRGVHSTGVLCLGHDVHICNQHQVCEIRHDTFATFSHRCVDNKHLTTHECSGAPLVGYSCHCSTQQCVSGSLFSSTTTIHSITHHTTPAHAFSTDSHTRPATSTHGPTTEKLTLQASTSAPTTSVHTTVTLAQTSQAQTTAQQMVTTVVTASATTLSHATTCTNDEDTNFSCVVYDQTYGMCGASTGTLFTIANKRCRKFCGICNADGHNSTISMLVTESSSTHAQPLCVDHDSRCVQFQTQLCSSTVSQDYVIATCPLTCGKCTEYFASLTVSPLVTETTTVGIKTTTLAPQASCHICGNIDNLMPCTYAEVHSTNSQLCPIGNSFCMTDVRQDIQGNTDVFKRCATQSICEQKWLNESAMLDYCVKYGATANPPSSYECHFCCQGDNCNTGIQPPNSTLVHTVSGK